MSHDLQLQLELDKMAAEKRGLSDEVATLTHSLDEHRAQSAKREAEWVESKEVVRGALGGQVVELQRQLSAVQEELSGTRQAAKEKEEELTQLYKKGAWAVGAPLQCCLNTCTRLLCTHLVFLEHFVQVRTCWCACVLTMPCNAFMFVLMYIHMRLCHAL